MDQVKVLSDVTAIIRGELNDDSIVLETSMSSRDIPGLDSLAQINIVAATELRFGIKFKTSDLESVRTVGEFCKVIDRELTSNRNIDDQVRVARTLSSIEIESEIEAFLSANFGLDISDRSTRTPSSLSALDSTGILELVAYIEDRFGFGVTDSELTAPNFGSIAGLIAYVSRKVNGTVRS